MVSMAIDPAMKEYWRAYADELVDRLTANGRIDNFTKNSALIGAYAEASVSKLIRGTVAPFRCSVGSVIGGDFGPKSDLRQLDLIIWDPTPLPPIFEEGDFALVPYQSVLGVLEVKRSLYPDVADNLKSTLDWVEERVPGHRSAQPSVKELIRQSGSQKTPIHLSEAETYVRDPFHVALGVVCLRLHGQVSGAFEKLVADGRAVVLQDQSADGRISVRAGHVLHLVEFAKQARVRGLRKLPSEGVDAVAIAEALGESPPGPLRRPSE